MLMPVMKLICVVIAGPSPDPYRASFEWNRAPKSPIRFNGVDDCMRRDVVSNLTFLEVFGTDVGVIYIQKGIELLVYEFDDGSGQSGWFSVVVAILFALSVYFIERSGTLSFGRKSLSRVSLIIPRFRG